MRGSVSPLSPNGEARAVTLTSDIGFQAEGVIQLILDSLDSNGNLRFLPMEMLTKDQPFRPGSSFLVDRKAYEEQAQRSIDQLMEEWPGMASGPQVSLLRLLLGETPLMNGSAPGRMERIVNRW